MEGKAYVDPSAVVHHNCIIEPGVYIGPGCVVGFPGEKDGFEDVAGQVIIRSGTRLEGLVSVDSGTEGYTVIERGCRLMKHSHVGHDAELMENVTLSPGAKVGGFCRIGAGCNFGMNSAIHQRLKMPPYCMVGMCCVITKKTKLKPISTYVGLPGRWIKWNKVAISRFNLSASDVDFIFGLSSPPDLKDTCL